MSGPLLRVRGLSISAGEGAGRFAITTGTDFDLGRGETLAIVGESGSGKSLTARAIARLLPPGVSADGTVVFDGADVLALPEKEMRRLRGNRIALILQDPFTMMNPLMRSGAHIEEMLAHRPEFSGRAARALEMKRDGTFDLAISDIDQWKALGNVDIITAPSLGIFQLTLDQSAPPFDDIHVRKAIAYAIDREGLVKALLKGNGEAAKALNPPEMWSGVLPPDQVRAFYDTIPNYPFDLEKAKAELKQSKHPDGFEIAVPGSTADPYMVNILQSVAENLKQIGIKMTVQEIDANQWLAGYFRHENMGMQIMPYYPDFADPANYPYLFFDSANAAKDGMNGSNYKNPAVDKLLDTANQNADPQARADALKQVFKIAADDVVGVPIFWPASAAAISNKYKLTGYSAFWYNIPWAIRGFGLK